MNEVDNIHFIEDEEFFYSLNQHTENNSKLKESQILTSVDSSVLTSIIEERSDR